MSRKAENTMCTRIFQEGRKRFGLLLLLGLCGLFTACGDTPQAVPDSGENQIYGYSLIFRDIPDPDEALRESGILAEHKDCQVLERYRAYQGNCIYRYLVFTDENYSYFEQCLQIFRKDSWTWEQTRISGTGWVEGRSVAITSVVGATDEGVFLEIIDFHAEDGEQRYLGFFDGIEGKLLMEWPKEADNTLVCQGQEINFVNSLAGTVYSYDVDGRQRGLITLDGFLEEGIVNPATENTIWYGGSRDGLRLWKDSRKSSSYELITVVAPYEARVACDPEGNLYFADAQAIWTQEKQPRKIMSFLESGYQLEKLYSIQAMEDGDLQCYVSVDGTLCLLELHRDTHEQTSEQKEIILYGAQNDIFLTQLITRFNRRNPQYHITFLESGEFSRIPAEIATGQGPDLLILSSSEAAEYARHGYIRSMEGIIEEPALFLDAAMENGRIDGITYGIPYCCTLDFPVFSTALVGNRSSWTVEEMMQLIEESDAEILFWYFSDPNAFQIVTEYGLYDNDNTDYIDWEKRESHLDEAPFARLLEFAKKYGDTGEYDMSEILSLTASGKIAGVAISLHRLGELDYAENFFSGRASYIGYPTSGGKRGIYTRAQCLYVNQATEQLEGITEFFRFMLSDEAQKLCVADGMCYQIPVRLSTIAYLTEQEQAKAKNPGEYGIGPISWLEDGLNESQQQVLVELLDQATPYNFYALEIYDILYEELDPYFQGNRSLEEAVAILDSRVQVYLNEKGAR